MFVHAKSKYIITILFILLSTAFLSHTKSQFITTILLILFCIAFHKFLRKLGLKYEISIPLGSAIVVFIFPITLFFIFYDSSNPLPAPLMWSLIVLMILLPIATWFYSKNLVKDYKRMGIIKEDNEIDNIKK